MDTSSRQILTVKRDAHLFSAQPILAEKLEQSRRKIQLAPDQLLHPDVPMAYIVRLGKLRVTQFLPRGIEVTRAVLQAGSLLIAEENPHRKADPAANVYYLAEMVLMALGEVELWALPPAALEQV